MRKSSIAFISVAVGMPLLAWGCSSETTIRLTESVRSAWICASATATSASTTCTCQNDAYVGTQPKAVPCSDDGAHVCCKGSSSCSCRQTGGCWYYDTSAGAKNICICGSSPPSGKTIGGDSIINVRAIPEGTCTSVACCKRTYDCLCYTSAVTCSTGETKVSSCDRSSSGSTCSSGQTQVSTCETP